MVGIQQEVMATLTANIPWNMTTGTYTTVITYYAR
jgi:hypothetical protein